MPELTGSTTDKAADTATPEVQPGERLRQMPVKQLQPGKYQPRLHMDPAKLSELSPEEAAVLTLLKRRIGRDLKSKLKRSVATAA